MTALAADRETARKDPGYKSLLMGTDIIYKGGMVTYTAAGLAVAGQATAGYKFAGVAAEKVDDSAGAGTKWCKVYTEGLFLLVATSITQAMVGQMMYLADDQTFDDVPAAAAAIPCGILVEYVSATSGWIDIGPAVDRESAVKTPVVTISAATTLTVEESGTIFLVGTDALTITLPSTEKGIEYTFVNIGADDAVLVTVDPAAADGIYGTIAAVSMTGTDGGALTNTKTGANKGDWAKIVGDGNAGWYIVGGDGVWAGA
jgi:hypothetical protein